MFKIVKYKRKCVVCHNYSDKYVPLNSYYDQQRKDMVVRIIK